MFVHNCRSLGLVALRKKADDDKGHPHLTSFPAVPTETAKRRQTEGQAIRDETEGFRDTMNRRSRRTQAGTTRTEAEEEGRKEGTRTERTEGASGQGEEEELLSAAGA